MKEARKSTKISYKRVALAFLLSLLVISLSAGTVHATDLGTDGVATYNANNPSYVDYTIPASMSGGELRFIARGGDGGYAKITLTGTGSGSCVGPGGRGAVTVATFRIGPGTDDIPVGSSIRFVVGGVGGHMEISGPLPQATSGGGGGSAVLLQRPGSSTWEELLVAGGGGGSHQAFNFPQNECTKSWGKSGEAGNNGSSGSGGSNGSAGTNGNGGCSGSGSGGGGAKSRGKIGTEGCSSAAGAIGATNTGQMGRYAGGAGGTVSSSGKAGGFGYGGGGSAFDDTGGGGGGGGWSGGGGGAQFYGGGGGGSYICSVGYAPASDLLNCSVRASFAQWEFHSVAANMPSDNGAIEWQLIPNNPPTVNALGDGVGAGMTEGGLVGFSVAVSDLDGDSLSVSASVGSMTDNGDGTWQWQYQTADGPDESTTVTISASDGRGGTGSDWFNLTVSNVAPTVSPISGATTATLGETKTYTFTTSDPGADTFSNVASVESSCGPNNIRTLFVDPVTGAGEFTCTFREGSSAIVSAQVADSDGADSNVSRLNVELTCPSFPMNVGTELALNIGIRCFNEAVNSGVYSMTLTADISLITSTTTISNTGAGIVLALDGVGNSLDGQEIADVRPLDIDSGTHVLVDDLTVTGGNMTGTGGGIRNSGTLTLTSSIVISNSANGGGGIHNLGTLLIDQSTIANNQQGIGGGIWNDNSLTVTNSTFSMNTGSNGGGIYNSATGALSVVNSTFSANSVTFQGGGISNDGSISTIANSTFVGNSATGFFGGGIRSIGTITSIANTIIAGSPAGGNCTGVAPSSNSHDITDSNGCWGWTNSLVPATHLGPLADNGGKTQTMALLETAVPNPAIDGGDPAFTPPPGTDQRGEARVKGRLDIGAVETCGNPITVLNAGDAGVGSLRQALLDVCSGGLIIFDNGLSGSTIALSSELDIDTDVTISGTAPITISGSSSVRVFFVQPNRQVTFDTLTIANGNTGGYGGGIMVTAGATVTVSNSTLSGNTSTAGGGGVGNFGTATISNSTLSGNTSPAGGGIVNDGTVTVTNSTLANNVSDDRGGGIWNTDLGTVTISNSTLSDNTATGGGGDGGGIFNNRATVTVSNSTLSGNIANRVGGGIANNSGSVAVSNSTFLGNSASSSDGGGIWNDSAGTMTLSNSIVANSTNGNDCGGNSSINSLGYNLDSDNSCGLSATGDITNTNPLLNPLGNGGGPTQTHLPMAGSPVLDAGDPAFVPPPATDQRGQPRVSNGRLDIGAVEDQCSNPITVLTAADAGTGSLRQALLDVCSGGVITFDNGLSGSTIPLSSELDIDTDVTISGTAPITISGSSSVRVFDVQANQRVTFDSLTIANGNYSGSDCGALGSSACGGGIMVKSGATVTVSNSTLSSNSAVNIGGGIFNLGTVTVRNSTLSGNSSAVGGGIGNGGTVTIGNSTFSGNTATSTGGGIYNDNSATVTVSNSIIANSTNGDCAGGTITSLGYNLISDNSCGFSTTGDMTSTPPLLLPLGNNGGPTQTHALGVGSPAIDAIPSTVAAASVAAASQVCGGLAPDRDQRDLTRPQGNGCDIGSFELDVALAVTLGWFKAEDNGDAISFHWTTVTETGTAGFNLLGVTDQGKIQLNDALIPSLVIDSVMPTDYSATYATNTTHFYLQEVGIDGGVTDYGPFALGDEHGANAQPDNVELTPRLWLPLIQR